MVRTLQLSETTVHPRACGERLNLLHNRVQSSGSSPRVRGTGFVWREKLLEEQLDEAWNYIPARAN